MVTVYVLATDTALVRALLQRLGDYEGITALRFDADAPPREGDIVVALANACPLERCMALVASGFRVVVLVAVARPAEGRAYLRAGATHYLPMTLDFSSLIDALRASPADCQTNPD